MLPCAAVPEEPFEPLYDAVALGMWAYTRTAFRVQTLGRFAPRAGLMLVCAHRAETDVPLICPSLYCRAGYFRDRAAERIHFAARDDMFDRGFFAGFPGGLPPRARRFLYPLRAGLILPRVRVHPVPYPGVSVLRLGRVLEWLGPETPLAEVLPEQLAELFRARARAEGRPIPAAAGDVLSGAYADLLWKFCSREELDAPLLESVWQRRAAEGAAAVRRLVELVRAGQVLLIFPEGRPSPDGSLSDFQAGLATLVRLGRPEAVQPVGIAYDRLTEGRARAVVSFGPPIEPPAHDVEQALRRAVARAMPVTCGAVAAAELAAAADEGRAAIRIADLETTLAAAAAAGRPAEEALATAAGRRTRLAECLRTLVTLGLVARRGRHELVLDGDRVRANRLVMCAARERRSVLAAG